MKKDLYSQILLVHLIDNLFIWNYNNIFISNEQSINITNPCWVMVDVSHSTMMLSGKKLHRRPADAGSNQSLLYFDVWCIGKHMEEHWS